MAKNEPTIAWLAKSASDFNIFSDLVGDEVRQIRNASARTCGNELR